MKIAVDIVIIDNDEKLLDLNKNKESFFNFKSNEDVVIEPGTFKTIGTGLKIGIPDGWEIDILSITETIETYGVVSLDEPGLCDSGYKEEYKVILVNLGTKPFIIKKYDIIAKGKILPAYKMDFKIVKNLDDVESYDGSEYNLERWR